MLTWPEQCSLTLLVLFPCYYFPAFDLISVSSIIYYLLSLPFKEITGRVLYKHIHDPNL
jgi:hypothetical protein